MTLPPKVLVFVESIPDLLEGIFMVPSAAARSRVSQSDTEGSASVVLGVGRSLIVPFRWPDEQAELGAAALGPGPDEYRSGRVHVPPEAQRIERALSEGRIPLVLGRGASGKTVLALTLAMRHAGPAVYLDLALDHSEESARKALQLVASDDLLCVLDNIHRAPDRLLLGLPAICQAVGSRMLLCARDLSLAIADPLDYWRSRADVESIVLLADSLAFQGVFSRCAAKFGQPPRACSSETLESWVQLFGGELLAFSAALAAEPRILRGLIEPAPVHAAEYVREQWIKEVSDDRLELERLLRLCALTEMEIPAPHAAFAPDTPFSAIFQGQLRKGTVLRIGTEPDCSYTLPHPKIGTLILAGLGGRVDARALRTRALEACPSLLTQLLRAALRNKDEAELAVIRDAVESSPTLVSAAVGEAKRLWRLLWLRGLAEEAGLACVTNCVSNRLATSRVEQSDLDHILHVLTLERQLSARGEYRDLHQQLWAQIEDPGTWRRLAVGGGVGHLLHLLLRNPGSSAKQLAQDLLAGHLPTWESPATTLASLGLGEARTILAALSMIPVADGKHAGDLLLDSLGPGEYSALATRASSEPQECAALLGLLGARAPLFLQCLRTALPSDAQRLAQSSTVGVLLLELSRRDVALCRELRGHIVRDQCDVLARTITRIGPRLLLALRDGLFGGEDVGPSETEVLRLIDTQMGTFAMASVMPHLPGRRRSLTLHALALARALGPEQSPCDVEEACDVLIDALGDPSEGALRAMESDRELLADAVVVFSELPIQLSHGLLRAIPHDTTSSVPLALVRAACDRPNLVKLLLRSLVDASHFVRCAARFDAVLAREVAKQMIALPDVVATQARREPLSAVSVLSSYWRAASPDGLAALTVGLRQNEYLSRQYMVESAKFVASFLWNVGSALGPHGLELADEDSLEDRCAKLLDRGFYESGDSPGDAVQLVGMTSLLGHAVRSPSREGRHVVAAAARRASADTPGRYGEKELRLALGLRAVRRSSDVPFDIPRAWVAERLLAVEMVVEEGHLPTTSGWLFAEGLAALRSLLD